MIPKTGNLRSVFTEDLKWLCSRHANASVHTRFLQQEVTMTKKKSSSSASARRLLLAEELEGIENKIMETGLLSDLVPIDDFDVQLQIFECEKTTAKHIF